MTKIKEQEYDFSKLFFGSEAPIIRDTSIAPNSYFMMSHAPNQSGGGFLSISRVETGLVEFQNFPNPKLYGAFYGFVLTPRTIFSSKENTPPTTGKGTATLVNGTAQISAGAGRVYCSYKNSGTYPGFVVPDYPPNKFKTNFLTSTCSFDDGIVNWVSIEPNDISSAKIIPGTETLTNGSVDVALPAITDQSVVLISRRTQNGRPGYLESSYTPGVGFSISSTESTDNGSVDWFFFPD